MADLSASTRIFTHAEPLSPEDTVKLEQFIHNDWASAAVTLARQLIEERAINRKLKVETARLNELISQASTFWISNNVGIQRGPQFGDEESWQIIGDNEQNGTEFTSLSKALKLAQELIKEIENEEKHNSIQRFQY